jgi:PIN domain nuclease of toxin-antitoxin system
VTRYVLDSYAILAHLRNEDGAATVHEILHDPKNNCWMALINLGEVYYKTAREEDSDVARSFVRRTMDTTVQFVEGDLSLTMRAAEIKAQFHLAYADCFAAALAQQMSASVVTGDIEFKQLEEAGVVNIVWLAPKARTRRR